MIDRTKVLEWCAYVEETFKAHDRVSLSFLQQAIVYCRDLCGEAPADPRQPLLEEAAFLLEQEGWLLGRMIHEGKGGHRFRQFADRHQKWIAKVRAYRTLNPGTWAEPPDNS